MAAEGIAAEVDTTKAQAFAGRLLTSLNDAALCFMVSVGHRTGLFDVMTQSPPATSEDLASRAGLNERYVREWLGAMVTARVVTIRSSHQPFHAAGRTCSLSDSGGRRRQHGSVCTVRRRHGIRGGRHRRVFQARRRSA